MGTWSTKVVIGTTKVMVVVVVVGMTIHETTRTTRTFVIGRTAPKAIYLISVDAGHDEEESQR